MGVSVSVKKPKKADFIDVILDSFSVEFAGLDVEEMADPTGPDYDDGEAIFPEALWEELEKMLKQ